MRQRSVDLFSRLPSALALAAACVTLLWGPPSRAALPSSRGEVVLKAAWGSGPGQLGRRGGEESNPEGPMSFTADPSGDLWILDQVNQRVVLCRKGKRVSAVPLGTTTFQDVALASQGRLLLLDRLDQKLVAVVDTGGKVLGDVPLEGHGIPHGGGTTALLMRTDGLWVEYAHRVSVQVLDGNLLVPSARQVVAGRPACQQPWLVSARRVGNHAVQVVKVDRVRDVILADKTLTLDEPVSRIVTVDADGDGNTLLAVHLVKDEPRKAVAGREQIRLLWLDEDLEVKSRITTRPSVGPWEQFKEIELSPDGWVYQMVFLPGGVEVRRWAR